MPGPTTTRLPLLLVLVFAMTGCEAHDHDGHTHDHSHSHGDHSHGDHDHDHGHGDHDHGHGDHHSHSDHDHGHGDHDHGDHDHSHGDHGHSHGDHSHSHGDHDHGHGDHDHGHGEVHFPTEYQQKVGFEVVQPELRTLRPTTPVYARITPTASGQARVTAPFDGEVRAPSGGILEVGEPVEAGQILAYVTPRIDPGEVTRIASDVETAQAQLTRAQRELERTRPLVESGAMPARALADAESDLALAEVELNRASQRRQQVGTAGRRATAGSLPIRSPIAGVVVQRSLLDGGFVTTGEALVEIIDRDTLWLEARIAEADFLEIDEPRGLWFSLQRQGPTHEIVLGEDSRLISFGEVIDPSTRTATMIVEMTSPPPTARVGASFRAFVYGERSEPDLTIPASAVLEEAGMDVVFVVLDDEHFERRVVQLGLRDGDYVGVVAGLDQGDRVVATGAYHVLLAAAATGEVGHGHSH